MSDTAVTTRWKSIEEENQAYWTNRAPSYTGIIRAELDDGHLRMWGGVVRKELKEHFGGNKTLDILEVGTGPGFLSILLAGMGHRVTGVDYTPDMLGEAKENARRYGAEVDLRLMNAEALEFGDKSFDLVISRNLTWNLPHPDRAYREWERVLRPGGLILVFDANYYRFLFDEKALAAYENDRRMTARAGEDDIYLCTDTEAMEAIARQLPFSRIDRPEWDTRFLTGLGMTASTDEDVWRQVWDRNEQINQASVPMFLVRAGKPQS